ncbi:MAG TPA: PorP/SprF family type IX secretion system membrane protein [Flavipsychrobacter sp.]|jgi:type IX secretion system PorP/SprF family membrane protein|nr:PorP/SprF family type IX secretion system membrane protein [Flavipsychrobacter sp.]
MKKILLGLSAFMALITNLQAQDIHNTQYFAAPLTLNPANTGLVQCDYRVAVNYRTQWNSVSSNPYTTVMGTFDMATMKRKLNNGDALGIGVAVYYDKAGAGSYTNLSIGPSLAYHKALGNEKQHILSLGVQASLVQKSIDFNKLTFEDQFDVSTGGTPYATGEHFGNTDLTYPDFAAGLSYTGRINEHATAYAGFSAYHLSAPVESFMKGGSSHKIHRRYTAYLGGSFDLNENVVLYASGLFQQQAKASETVLGTAIGFVLNPGYDPEYRKPTIFYLGGWYRFGDAIAPYVALSWTKMQFALSYDVTVSNFTTATNGNGAMEVSLIFNGCINPREKAPTYNFTCPKF